MIESRTFPASYKMDTAQQYIEEIAHAFQKSKTLFTACELNIFTLIGEDDLSAEDISSKINTDLRATTRLLDGVASLGLLSKKNRLYSNTSESYRHLVKGNKEYLGNMNHMSNLWESWSELTKIVQTGNSTHVASINDKSRDWIDNFVMAAHWKAGLEAPQILDKIDLRKVRSVLDLGCGTGVFSLELLKRKPELDITLFDYPHVIEFTNDNLRSHNSEDKVKVLEGDFFSDNLGKSYDLIFIANVLHDYSIWQNVKLLQKCYDALNLDGQIVIAEGIIDDDRTSPVSKSMFALNLLCNTYAGDAYTETDIWVMLREAWFRDIERIDTECGKSLMIGRR
jgi:tRNA A58 N-methylase Trm61